MEKEQIVPKPEEGAAQTPEETKPHHTGMQGA